MTMSKPFHDGRNAVMTLGYTKLVERFVYQVQTSTQTCMVGAKKKTLFHNFDKVHTCENWVMRRCCGKKLRKVIFWWWNCQCCLGNAIQRTLSCETGLWLHIPTLLHRTLDNLHGLDAKESAREEGEREERVKERGREREGERERGGGWAAPRVHKNMSIGIWHGIFQLMILVNTLSEKYIRWCAEYQNGGTAHEEQVISCAHDTTSRAQACTGRYVKKASFLPHAWKANTFQTSAENFNLSCQSSQPTYLSVNRRPATSCRHRAK